MVDAPELPCDLRDRLEALDRAPPAVAEAVDAELDGVIDALAAAKWLRWWGDGRAAPAVRAWSRARRVAEIPTLARWLPWSGAPTRFDLFGCSFNEHAIMSRPEFDAQVWDGDPDAVAASHRWYRAQRSPMARLGEPMSGLPALARRLTALGGDLGFCLLAERLDQADRGPFSLTDPPLDADDGPEGFDLMGTMRRDLEVAMAGLTRPTLVGLAVMEFEGHHNDTEGTALVASR